MIRVRACGSLVVVGAAIVAAGQAHADYTGVTIEKHTTVAISGQNYDVWRVYANFSDPGDRLVAVYGVQATPIVIQSRNSTDTDFGNPFFNVGEPGENVTAPSQSGINANPALRWDTFVTIGTPVSSLVPGGDRTSLSPFFVPLEGTNWTQNNQVWYVIPLTGDPPMPPVQTLAGWAGDGDTQLRVMMMQLTVREGENIRGSINLSWYMPAVFGGTEINVPVQTFNSFIPGPSGVALLGLAVLAARWRRRSSQE